MKVTQALIEILLNSALFLTPIMALVAAPNPSTLSAPGSKVNGTATGLLPVRAIAELDGQHGIYKRRVFLFAFLNEKNDRQTDYLSASIPNAFSIALVRTDRFVVLNRGSVEHYATQMGVATRDLYDTNNAVRFGRAVGADVVIVGRFSTVDNAVTVKVRAVDVQSGTLSAEDSQRIVTNASMFQAIDLLAERMSKPMAERLKPLTAPPPPAEAVAERVHAVKSVPIVEGQTARLKKYHANAYLSLGLPLSQISDHIGANFGARGTLRHDTFQKWPNPMIIADASYATGKDITSMIFYFVGAGFTYPFHLPKGIQLLPFAAFGFSGGRLNYQSGYSFLEAGMDAGFAAEYAMSANWHISASIYYRHIFDKYVPGGFLQSAIGAGYNF